MQVWKLTRIADAGFATHTYDCGVFVSEELAKSQAMILEPNAEIRDYEYHVRAIDVLTEAYPKPPEPDPHRGVVLDSRYDDDEDGDDEEDE